MKSLATTMVTPAAHEYCDTVERFARTAIIRSPT
jgi:hypothetical protein